MTASSVTSSSRTSGDRPWALTSPRTPAVGPEGARRQVDGHRQDEVRGRPGRVVGQRPVQHHLGQCGDQAAVLCGVEELARRQEAALGVLPTPESLDAGHRPRRERDLRLVVHPELALGDAAPQLAVHREPSAVTTVEV